MRGFLIFILDAKLQYKLKVGSDVDLEKGLVALHEDDHAVELIVLLAAWGCEGSITGQLSELGNPFQKSIRRKVVTKLIRRRLEDLTCHPSISKFLLRDVHEMSQLQHTVRDDDFVLRYLS